MAVTSWTTGVSAIELDDHSSRHENGGDDEINVEGLSGVLADPQHVIVTEVDSQAMIWALVFGG